MKGVIFTEFLEMVEARFGLAVLDRIIAAAAIPHGGAYTAVGTYDHREMVQLVGALSAVTGDSSAELTHSFGRYLFERLQRNYPILFVGVRSAFEFLRHVDRHIHVEVKKLYPDAELPVFRCECAASDRLAMLYQSSRPFTDLAEGLIQGCIAHYAEKIAVHREVLESGATNKVRFVLTRES